MGLLAASTLGIQYGCSWQLNQLSLRNVASLVEGHPTWLTKDRTSVDESLLRMCGGDNRARVYYQSGLAYQYTKEFENAIDMFHRARVIDFANQPSFLSEGKILSDTGRLNEAVAVWAQGGVEKYFMALGKSALASGDLIAAEANFKLSMAINPNEYPAYPELGSVYRLASNWNRAAFIYRQSIAMRPDDLDANYHLGVVLLALGDFAGAREQASISMRLDSTYVWSYILMGDAYRLEKAYKDAEKWYRNAQDAAGEKDLVARSLGLTALDQGDANGALSYFNQIPPDSARILQPERYWLLGMAYARSGQLVPASQELELAFKMAPDNVAYALELAKVYRALGRIDTAKATYQHVLQIEPTNSSAKSSLEQLDAEK